MEKIIEQAMLYDFYGELLNNNQRSVYENYVLDNLSLSEIAEEKGISRQGVFDMVKRCDSILYDYESKLHLLKKFLNIKSEVSQIMELTEDSKADIQYRLDKIKSIATRIVEDL